MNRRSLLASLFTAPLAAVAAPMLAKAAEPGATVTHEHVAARFVGQGTWSTVGESGPELVFAHSGYIVPPDADALYRAA